MLAIINDAARAYQGVIPADRWHEPYMSADAAPLQVAAPLQGLVDKPILIGIWATASWAIDFYRRNGFTVFTSSQKDRLLRRYWSIPDRQIATSVVLASPRWMKAQ